MESVQSGFLSMNKNMVLDQIRKRLDKGENPFLLLKECQEAMEQVGKKFETGEFFLSELMYSGEIFKAVSPILGEKLAQQNPARSKPLGPILFGTPEGDIHDLGKNLVITYMRANGFEVIDLGVDVSVATFVAKLREINAPILAMSGLITPALMAMQRVVKTLETEGLRQKTFILIGGPLVSDLVVRETGADARGADPTAAVRICREYLEGEKSRLTA